MGSALMWSVAIDGRSDEEVAALNRDVVRRIQRFSRGHAVQSGAESPQAMGWNAQLAGVFLHRLGSGSGRAQASTIRRAAANGGSISRDEAYEELGTSQDARSLKGFTRPINRVVQQMKQEGLLDESVSSPLRPKYDPDRKGYQRAVGFEIPPEAVSAFAAAE